MKSNFLRTACAFSALALLTGCATPQEAKPDTSTGMASPSSTDEDWVDHVVASPSDLAISDWATVDNLTWETSNQATEGFNSEEVAALARYLSGWAEVASFSEDVLFADDHDAAVEAIEPTLTDSRYIDAYRDLYDQNDDPLGFATVLADEVTLWDDIRAHVEWNFSDTEAYDLPALHGSASVSGYLPVIAEGNQTWAFVIREYHLTTTDPVHIDEAGFWFGYNYMWVGDTCDAKDEAKISGTAIAQADVEQFARIATEVDGDTYTTAHDVAESVTEWNSTEGTCATQEPSQKS